MHKRFSHRYGFRSPAPPVTVLNEAPPDLRYALPMIAEEAGLRPKKQREIVCRVLRKQPNPGNWSDYPNIQNEVLELLESCPWWKVYDVAEEMFRSLKPVGQGPFLTRTASPAELFRRELNEALVENGVGWEMNEHGQLVLRSDEFSIAAMQEAQQALSSANLPLAQRELQMAREALSRRPEADVTGVVQHSMAALESVVKQVTKSSRNLGGASRDLQRLGIPAPLCEAISSLYGYASSDLGGGRHGSEQLHVDHAEARLIFHLSASVATYLLAKVTR